MSETLNPFLNAQRQVKKACDKLKLDPSVYELLKEPEKVLIVSIPVKMDDGTMKNIYRLSFTAQYSHGAYKRWSEIPSRRNT